jgi:hypothetical protein
MMLRRHRRSARERALVEEAIAAYRQWRQECAAVRTAYRGWLGARAAHRRFAFDDYNAALDREERAAGRYALVMGRAGHLRETAVAQQLAQIELSSRR